MTIKQQNKKLSNIVVIAIGFGILFLFGFFLGAYLMYNEAISEVNQCISQCSITFGNIKLSCFQNCIK